MFAMDIPYVPAQETLIVLAQAATPGTAATPQPDYLLKMCQETESTGDPMSAMNGVDPAGLLAGLIGNMRNQDLLDSLTADTIKITMLQGTTNGKLVAHTAGNGRLYYMYAPPPNYTGNDSAVFLAEFEGKVYKIVINLVVSPQVGESPLLEEEQPVCPAPQLIKVNGKPVSGSSGLNTGSITLTIANLPNAAVGQTVGTAITLDTTAAGNGWYIDPNPAANTDFLPTSDPNVWIVKAGSDTAGKLDASAFR